MPSEIDVLWEHLRRLGGKTALTGGSFTLRQAETAVAAAIAGFFARQLLLFVEQSGAD